MDKIDKNHPYNVMLSDNHFPNHNPFYPINKYLRQVRKLPTFVIEQRLDDKLGSVPIAIRIDCARHFLVF
jgi:hypothetical protein